MPDETVSGNQEVRLVFHNRTELVVAVYWVGPEQCEHLYRTLMPDESYAQATRPAHEWRVRPLAGQAADLGHFEPNPTLAAQTFDITDGRLLPNPGVPGAPGNPNSWLGALKMRLDNSMQQGQLLFTPTL